MGIHANTEDMTGNIVLFKKSTSFIDTVISTATKGPYVHCAIVVDATGKTIEATTHGIGYNTIPADKTKYTMISLLAPPFTMDQSVWEKRIQFGVQWACSYVGQTYGWMDIIDQAVNFLFPGNSIQLVDRQHYDCSDFVTRYLMVLGYPLPASMQEPYAVSPNDIARYFSISF